VKLKVVLNKNGTLTRVLNAETGELVEGIHALRWEAKPGSLVNVVLEMCASEIEVELADGGGVPTGFIRGLDGRLIDVRTFVTGGQRIFTKEEGQ